MKKKKPTNGGAAKHQQGVRMDEELEARIRKYQELVQKKTGLEVSFSSAVRSLIERGLEAASA